MAMSTSRTRLFPRTTVHRLPGSQPSISKRVHVPAGSITLFKYKQYKFIMRFIIIVAAIVTTFALVYAGSPYKWADFQKDVSASIKQVLQGSRKN
ncbi:unnamed protein product [Medioppia subpectinata]|uniref:Uncharacterized protein n=1 Tax=Medioppia subpectinata TaxID=1979941 RepID=A0A7R9L5D8_9ACAR|nr:unnamed protein product [Medioppia subpectinata]CAG2115654.1 unnamed protein product [Medioppia subpectinata]